MWSALPDATRRLEQTTRNVTNVTDVKISFSVGLGKSWAGVC